MPPVQSAKSVAVDNTIGTIPTATVTAGSNVAAGNRLLLFTSHFGFQSNTDIPTPTDTLGLTWTNLASNQVNDSLGSLHTLWVDLWTAEVTVGGAITITITASPQTSGSNNVIGASLQEWAALSKAPTVGALDVAAAGTGLSNATGNVSTGTTSASHAGGQVAVAFAADWGSGLTWSVASGGFTKDTTASRDADSNAACIVAYKTSSSGATEAATFSPSSGTIGSDVVGLVAVLQLQLVQTDTGTGTEPTPTFGTMALPKDSGTGTDVTTSPILAVQTGTGIDTLAVVAPVNISDSGAGAELVPLVAFTEPDSGVGADIPTTGNIGGVGPTGVTTIFASDTGTGVDSAVPVGAQPTAALFDDFNAATRNAILWNAAGDTSQGPPSGRLQLHATPRESLYRTVAIYTLEGSTVQVRFVTTPTASDASVTLGVTDGVNVAQIGWVNGPTPAIAVGWCNGPTWTTMAAVTYNPALHGYWRLRADTIGTIFHETAPTAAGPWTTLFSGVPGWAPTTVTVIVAAATLATADGGWAELDDVNVIGQSVLDAGAETDSVVVGPSVVDIGAGADPALTISEFLTVADSGVGTDISPSPKFSIPESGTGFDVLSVAGAIQISDTGTGTDTAATALTPPADTGVGVEIAANALTVTEHGQGIDVVVPSVLVNISDTAAGAELPPLVTVRVADTGTGGETLTNTSPLAMDAGTGTDNAVIGFLKIDVGSGTDTATPSVTVPAADTGTGVDTLTVNKVAPAADTGTGTDQPLAVTFAVPSEGGAGIDSLTIRVSVVDVGAGIELLVIQTTLTDLGAGGDAQTVFTGFSVIQADTGTGAEILALVKLLADTGTAVDGITGPGSVISGFARSYVRSSAGRTFVETAVC